MKHADLLPGLHFLWPCCSPAPLRVLDRSVRRQRKSVRCALDLTGLIEVEAEMELGEPVLGKEAHMAQPSPCWGSQAASPPPGLQTIRKPFGPMRLHVSNWGSGATLSRIPATNAISRLPFFRAPRAPRLGRASSEGSISGREVGDGPGIPRLTGSAARLAGLLADIDKIVSTFL